ncbi:MAG: dTDP-4-dehydrorhamnose 3,5-epimerase [Saprospiraceae bacterium]|nr:dTDP-4-dehydrorhamnose 3,5-epimerase [Saprospiraceae bacterium]
MIRTTGINGLYLIEPKVHRDHRGYFLESFNKKWFDEYESYNWVQDNEALSHKGVLRGLHYQVGDHAQAKLVRVISGEVLDVVADLRPGSPSYGKVFSEILSGENKRQILIPRGFGHGYIVLADETIFAYKCDNHYAPEHEGGIHPLDDQLDIDWLLPHDMIILSDKDNAHPPFGQHVPAL